MDKSKCDKIITTIHRADGTALFDFANLFFHSHAVGPAKEGIMNHDHIRAAARCGGARLRLMLWAAALVAVSGAAAAQSIDGVYTLIGDTGGRSVKAGAVITLTVSGSPSGTMAVVAVQPGQTITDTGTFTLRGGRITLSFQELGWAATGAAYTLGGGILVLPFKALDDGPGTSRWKMLSGGSGGGGSGDSGDGGGAGGSGKGSGSGGGSGAGSGGSSGGSGGSGGKGSSGGSGGKGGSGGSGGTGGSGGSGGAGGSGGPGGGRGGAEKLPTIKDLAGNWTGRAAGEEVRFRDPNSLLILTVKHNAEFFFHVDETGRITGEGTIEYDLERNTEGLDSLAAGVKGLMGMMPGAPGLPGKGAAAGVAGKMGDATRDVPGVTSLQYDAPHLKHGKELRHFTFTGQAEMSSGWNSGERVDHWKMTLVQEGPFTLPDGSTDNQLIAAYEVNKVKEEKPFPCWSPFMKESGTLRRGPGGAWVVEFQRKGTHREGKKVWQEYGYVWMARQIR